MIWDCIFMGAFKKMSHKDYIWILFNNDYLLKMRGPPLVVSVTSLQLKLKSDFILAAACTANEETKFCPSRDEFLSEGYEKISARLLKPVKDDNIFQWKSLISRN